MMLLNGLEGKIMLTKCAVKNNGCKMCECFPTLFSVFIFARECYFGCMCEMAIFPPCKQYFLLVKKEALQKERR